MIVRTSPTMMQISHAGKKEPRMLTDGATYACSPGGRAQNDGIFAGTDDAVHWHAIVRRSVMIHDQSRSALIRQVRPHPLEKDADAQVRLRKELEMHGGPGHPCEKAADPHAARLQNGKALADDGHVSFVEVPKWSRRGFS